MNYQIAIDGPSATGKSSTAKLLAKELSFIYIDTGAMYRAIGLYFLNNNISCDDEEQINKELNKINVTIGYVDDNQKVYLNGDDVTDFIRTNEVSHYASVVSSYKLVREKLVELQQELANNNNVIMDGRDIGTVVLPNAFLKIYMTATSEERANRRYKELLEKGQEVSLPEVKKELEERDYRDTHRENSPLMKAIDAVELDTTCMTLEEVVNKIKEIYLEKRGN